jgi:hypothetical protein
MLLLMNWGCLLCFLGSSTTLYAGQHGVQSGPQAMGASSGTGTTMSTPCACAVDANGVLYVVDLDISVIFVIQPGSSGVGGAVTIIGVFNNGDTGGLDGNITTATFTTPTSITYSKTNNVLYVVDWDNTKIRRIDLDVSPTTSHLFVTTLVGSNGNTAFVDGLADHATFHSPRMLSKWQDHLYVTDLTPVNNAQVIRCTLSLLISLFPHPLPVFF